MTSHFEKRIAIGVGAALSGGLGALGGCEIVAVTAANFVEKTKFTVDGEMLFMSGEIKSKADEQFEAIIAANPQITAVVECNVPGSLDDNTMIPLSYSVRALGLKTHLTSVGEIASGGVYFFLAGVERTMAEGAYIGIHSWSDVARDAPEHITSSGYINAMLGNDAFYWFTIEAAPAAGIYQISNDEIEAYGMLTQTMMIAGPGPVCPTQ